jgi:Uncharacterized protein conserved in bacteria
LLLAILIAVLLLAGFLTQGFSANSALPVKVQDAAKGQPIFTVQANKQQLETMINHQMNGTKDSKLTYQVLIGDQVELKGTYRLLFTGIPFSLKFNPTVSNGDIVLKESEVKLGSIRLPDQEVLGFLKAGNSFPSWVLIRPNQRQVYINLSQIKMQGGLFLRAKTMDLPHNDVSFNVYQ